MTTAQDFAALLAEYQAADAAYEDADNSGDEDAVNAVLPRYREAFDALLAARPTDPKSLAAQLRWFVADEVRTRENRMLLHIATQLEAMAAAGPREKETIEIVERDAEGFSAIIRPRSG
jgi:hypothetical protein